MLQNAVRFLPDSVDDHEHLAEHLEDVCEGQEGDVGVALRAEDVDRERERLQGVEQVPLRQHHALRNTCVCLSVGAGWSKASNVVSLHRSNSAPAPWLGDLRFGMLHHSAGAGCS